MMLLSSGACRGSDAPTTQSTPPADASASSPPPASSSTHSTKSSAEAVPDAAPPPSPKTDGAPAPLACLAKLYVGRAVKDGKTWALELPDGSKVPWDDGKPKDMAARIEAPDVEDVFATPYKPGAITPVRDPEQDPGRARIEPLFRATYGATANDVSRMLVPVTFVGHKVQIHKLVAKSLERVDERLTKAIDADPSLRRFFATLGGTFNARAIAGTDRTSAHAWGIAIDIDVSVSDYWRNTPKDRPLVWVNRVPQVIVDAFEREQWAWGGRWFHFDTMHFEYRPELFDPTCRGTL
jgi:hypothetical protein